MTAAAALDGMLSKVVTIITCDGRNLVGNLRGFDQTTNLILDECHERVFSPVAGVEQVVLGLYIIRGDNIAIIGELDQEVDSGVDLSSVRAEPLKAVTH
mmetsp:Transcript_27629/g.61709  ORF Transcript_27629/g.61709 Transcript_27629/m.61709 type:complete len:99 (+) Transcript_27629:199-495(+)|eukprot:CAMPEP_0172618832 /NCGR_PEP_ID=MMETSP1068-20121228/86529_1 /TAXON_ID=35684 /ORGANISM="Pseudopedinella elastica, Strain CCMP716" /LENGTH=98 /DNA_ID=CAMNT_0013425281 /DNA_START=105 /DNA_END=401 /DNA_ORIENTATION=+